MAALFVLHVLVVGKKVFGCAYEWRKTLLRGLRSDFFDFGIGAGLEAALHDGMAHAVGEVLRELIGLLVTVDVDCLASGVDDDFAVVACAKVLLDLGEQIGFDLAIKVVG